MENTDLSIIAGVFRDRAKADRALEDLKQAGFRDDRLGSTVYNLNKAQEAEGSSEYAPEYSRIVVTVKAEGRDQDAVGILFDNGANNADLPPGTILKHGTLVSAGQEAVDLVPEPVADEGSFSKDSFFAEEKEPTHDDEFGIMDNPNFPHG
jgi:hypothetical protein